MATLTQVPAPTPEIGVSPAEAHAETEVSSERPKRRTFTVEYKRQILRQADACTKQGEIGALLRQEGLYWSHLVDWRKARKRGEIAGLTPKKRGPAAKVADPKDKRITELERELRRQTARAERAEALVEIQKKVSQLLGIPLPDSDEKGGTR